MKKLLLSSILVLAALAIFGCAGQEIVNDNDSDMLNDIGYVEYPSEETTDELAIDQYPTNDYEDYDDYEETQEKIELNNIYFDFDSSQIKESEKEKLKENLALINYNDLQIIIEGHCDERGTDEYNYILGYKRAEKVFLYLVTAGINPENLICTSLGEEKPIDRNSKDTISVTDNYIVIESSGGAIVLSSAVQIATTTTQVLYSTETAWAKNRRVELKIKE